MDTSTAPQSGEHLTLQDATATSPSPALADRVAVVTGAGRGIGRTYALRLAALGADVAIVDRDLRSFEEYAGERQLLTASSVGAEVEALGVRAIEIEADLSEPAGAGAMTREVLERFGRIDVCVCNAGGGTGAMDENAASKVDPDQLEAVIARNLLTTVNTCGPVAAAMREQRKGKLITVSSVSGLQPQRDGCYSHYAAAKAAVVAYTRNLAQELGPHGVTANVIAPGAIGTARLMPKYEQLGAAAITEKIALRRLGTVEDCAGVLEFLATDLSDYVTGQVIVVDGGLLV
jgi:3-oxoacyl-[acyl-carrier protein] reductase